MKQIAWLPTSVKGFIDGFFFRNRPQKSDLDQSLQQRSVSDILLLTLALCGVFQIFLGGINDYISFGLSRLIAYGQF